jgi:hypothetical protein
MTKVKAALSLRIGGGWSDLRFLFLRIPTIDSMRKKANE